MDTPTLLSLLTDAMHLLARLPRFGHPCDCVEASWTADQGAQVLYRPYFTAGRSAHKALLDQEEAQIRTVGLPQVMAALGPAFAAHPHFALFVASSDTPRVVLRAFNLGPDDAPAGQGFQLTLGRFGVGSVAPRHTAATVLAVVEQATHAAPTPAEYVAATQETTGSLVGQGRVPLDVLAALWPLFVPTPKPTLDAARYAYPMGLWTPHTGPNPLPDSGVVLFHNGAGGDHSMRFVLDPKAETGTRTHPDTIATLVRVIQSSLVHDAAVWVPHPSMPDGRILVPTL